MSCTEYKWCNTKQPHIHCNIGECNKAYSIGSYHKHCKINGCNRTFEHRHCKNCGVWLNMNQFHRHCRVKNCTLTNKHSHCKEKHCNWVGGNSELNRHKIRHPKFESSTEP